MILETRPDLEAGFFFFFLGFKGFDYPDLSVATGKEADGFIRLSGQEFPFLVLESGWSEPEKHLIEDARLWLWGTNSVNFVIVIQSVENALVEDPTDGTIKLADDCVQLQNPPEEENALQNAMKDHLIRHMYDKSAIAERLYADVKLD
jgi:hypothetical protein